MATAGLPYIALMRDQLARVDVTIDQGALERDLGQPLREAGPDVLHAIGCTLYRVYAVVLAADGRYPHASLLPSQAPLTSRCKAPDDLSSLTGPVI